MKRTVLTQVVYVYAVSVDAETDEDARRIVMGMSSLEIVRRGKMRDVTTDYVELDPSDAEIT